MKVSKSNIYAFGIVTISLLLLSCAAGGPGGTGFTAYRDGLFRGEEHLENGEYQLAMNEFLKSSAGDPTEPIPLALAGQSAYQLGDLKKAGEYLAQADRIRSDSNAYLIVRAYQALIAFKEDKREDGMKALADYIRAYKDSYPDRTLYQVENIYNSGNIAVAELEMIINDEVARYEKELFQFL